MPYKTLGKVAYDDTTFAVYARSVRRDLLKIGRSLGGRNVATIKVTTIGTVTLPSEPPAKGKAIAWHSEKALLNAVIGELKLGAKIEWIYTERQPCGSAQGHANCDKLLTEFMTAYGNRGTDTPVLFSFDYPTKEDMREQIRDGLLTEEEAAEIARDECQLGTAALIDAAVAL